jgi:glycosyltransferase involved in cell wall biosynthesis
MHVLLFLQYYHTPDCPTAARPHALARRLGEAHDVTVVTTASGRERRLTHRFDWSPPGVRLRMLDVPYDNAMSTEERIRAYASYAARGLVEGLRLPSPPDVVIGSSTPLTTPMAAALVAGYYGVPWIFEVRDLWPDFPIQMGAVPSPLAQAGLRWMERALYRSAAHVVTLSPDMEAHVREAVPSAPVATIEYGADLSLLPSGPTDPSAFDFGSRPVVLYAGTFGRANAIPALLDAARTLNGRSDALFVLAGDGHHAPTVDRAADRLPNVRRLPPRPYPQALRLFRRADLTLVPFIDLPVLSANAPGKLFDSLAAGTPVVVTTPGWMRALVRRHGCGWYAPPRADRLASRVASLCRAPARLRAAGEAGAALARRRYSRRRLLDRYAALVAGVASHGRSPNGLPGRSVSPAPPKERRGVTTES